ncbi:hypothetical protein FF011L_10110 [Roseimaritima multifibrata]|uniref:Uncharacterized protein n=1 Tax=Roseimaritima multifibrata TaxID=1930274 RepID=A0A517MBJ9_9BACT|nr:hypothetical protein [Roseimaritima multifibrata]QDS92269.1 hypothetical protein FF011L_10110 [Roseimaritima multifibrata]
MVARLFGFFPFWGALVLGAAGSLGAVLSAQPPLGPRAAEEGRPVPDGLGVPASLSAADTFGNPVELPRPEPAVRRVLERGNVRFVFYDGDRQPRLFPGKTELDLKFKYHARTEWEVPASRGVRILVIRPDYDRIDWILDHQIELPASLVSADFFADALVQHELDHVRISADPRIERLFRDRVRKNIQEIRIPWESDQPPLKSIVQQHVDRAIVAEFKQVLQFLQIRYRELDRVTKHGLSRLPGGFLEDAPDLERASSSR